MPLFTLEPDNTVQFTWQSSIAPDAAPVFSVTDRDGTMIHSATAATSDSTHYYALYTIPSGDHWYAGQWVAQKTISSSAYNFINRFGFRALQTQAEL